MKPKNHEERIKQLEEEKRILQTKLDEEKKERKLRDEIKEIKTKEFSAKHGGKMATLKRVGKNIKEDLVNMGKGLAKTGKAFSDHYYSEDKPKPKAKGLFEPSEDWSHLKKMGLVR